MAHRRHAALPPPCRRAGTGRSRRPPAPAGGWRQRAWRSAHRRRRRGRRSRGDGRGAGRAGRQGPSRTARRLTAGPRAQRAERAGGRDGQEVGGDDLLHVAPRCLVLAGVRVSLGIHLDGLGRALRLDAVALNDAFAHASKLGNTEDPARPGHGAGGALGQDPVAVPEAAREMSGLLRGAGARDGRSPGRRSARWRLRSARSAGACCRRGRPRRWSWQPGSP